ncbi:hypothetical protein [Leminorella grimontii]|uniref:hypothetical protein n=1 Tax=Leminorella grimontii TaxID=82981 RepID=UPI00041D6C23|nr:hypothetical protein [Leminorella grimontii]
MSFSLSVGFGRRSVHLGAQVFERVGSDATAKPITLARKKESVIMITSNRSERARGRCRISIDELNLKR